MHFLKSRFCTHLARKPNVYFSNSAWHHTQSKERLSILRKSTMTCKQACDQQTWLTL
jgi:hypothetical protein